MTGEQIELQAFNDRPPEAALELLHHACASSAWQRVLVASRPFGSVGELAATSDGVLTALGWKDVTEALATDPAVPAVGVGGSEEAVTYEARFGVPFLIDPAGKTADQLRGALAERLAHD